MGPGAGRTSVYPRVKGAGVRCRRVPGPFTDGHWLSVHLACDTGTRVLPGGAEEGAEEVAEGVPGQEVGHGGGKGGMSAGDVAPVGLLSDPILGIGTQVHGAGLGAGERIPRAS